MEKKILDALKDEIVKMEVQVVVGETVLEAINKMSIPGANAEMYAQQKSLMEASNTLNKIVIAELKSKYQIKEG